MSENLGGGNFLDSRCI